MNYTVVFCGELATSKEAKLLSNEIYRAFGSHVDIKHTVDASYPIEGCDVYVFGIAMPDIWWQLARSVAARFVHIDSSQVSLARYANNISNCHGRYSLKGYSPTYDSLLVEIDVNTHWEQLALDYLRTLPDYVVREPRTITLDFVNELLNNLIVDQDSHTVSLDRECSDRLEYMLLQIGERES